MLKLLSKFNRRFSMRMFLRTIAGRGIPAIAATTIDGTPLRGNFDLSVSNSSRIASGANHRLKFEFFASRWLCVL